MRRHCLPLILCLLLCVTAALAAPTMKATVREGEVKLDGVLDDAAWAKAPWQTNFLSASSAVENAGNPKPVAVQTRFKVLYDQGALYLAAECDEPQIENLRGKYTEHDNDVYADDCLEVFFDPAGEGRYYHHFIVNVKGAWFDDYNADYGLVHGKLWDLPLQTATTVDAAAKVWRLEVRIPLAALQLKGDAGNTWLWNVTRERQAGGNLELSTWSPLKGNFHLPRMFGKLTDLNLDYSRFAVTLGEPKANVSGGAGSTSDVELQVAVTNSGPAARQVTLGAMLFLQPATAVKSAAFDLAPGATQTATLPALKVRRDQTGAPVQLTVADAATGEPVKIAVKRLDTQYTPIALDIRRPVYRQCIFATESVPELVFRVRLAGDIAAKTAQVVYALLDGNGKEVRSGKAKAAQLAGDLKLEAAKLPVGSYTLTARALDKGDETVIETSTTIRKLPAAPGSEVRIDDKGNVVVNGKPRVFCGWYGGIPTEDPRPDVVALQDLTTPVVLGGITPEDVAKSIGEPFRTRGICSIVSIEPGRLLTTYKLWQRPGGGKELTEEIKKLSAPSEPMKEMLRQLVAAVQSEPGVVGYYLADEPEINDARSDWMEAVYKYMQEIDPYHPLMVTNDTLDGIVTHGYKTCDILSPDPYSPAWEYVPNFMKRCREVMRPGQAIMMTPWTSSGETHFNVEFGKDGPYPYEVTRHQFLTALAMGCKGYTGYCTPFFMPEPILRYGLPPIWRELRFLEAAAGNPQTPPTVKADAEMIAWAGQANGNVYLIVSNLKAGRRSATISHPLLKNLKSLCVASEERKVALTNGSFVDTFEEGAVHVYTSDPAAEKLTPVSAVAREIKAQQDACAKPGNLLYNRRGVLARSSDGFYAPWFTQFYYYALNGITDDVGWCLSHTDKPSTLDLTLPREEKIGRLVLYSPNLKDFDLELQAADGSRQVASIRDNFVPVAEVRFASQVPTLKLRLVALGKREGAGTQGINVAEIEAYTDAGAGPTTPLRAQESTTQAPTLPPPATETAGAPVLWREDFTKFEFNEKLNWDGKDTKWVLKPDQLRVAPKAGGSAVVTSISPVGYAGMNHFYPYNPEYRWFQVKIADIQGEGYKWLHGIFGDSSGKPGFRMGIHTNRPSTYTLDTHYVNEIFRAGTAKQCYLTMSVAGSGKNADGTGKAGPAFLLDWIQLVRRPQDGLAVTLADGSSLPEVLKQGDELLFRLFLDKPALDATVEVCGGSNYTPLAINGQTALQLVRVGAKDGTEWAAQVKLGPGTAKADYSSGYPCFFRAVLAGGAIKDTYAVAALKFE